MLVEQLLQRLILPLYIHSLNKGILTTFLGSCDKHCNEVILFYKGDCSLKLSDRPAVSRVVSLFLLSQIFLIHHNKALICAIVELLINCEDNMVAIATGRDVATEGDNITDEEKELRRTSELTAVRLSPHLDSIMESLIPNENDYEALFALSLLYAMGKNKGEISSIHIITLCKDHLM